MSSRLAYALDDGTEVRVILEGLAADAPDPTLTPPGAHYFATDTREFLVCTGLVWKSAVATANPGDATTSVEGFTLLRTAAGGAHPIALGVPDRGAASGVADLDSDGLVPSARYPIADATHLGLFKIGVGLQSDSDGIVSVIPGGVGDFGVEHNDGSVGTEPQLDFVDGGGGAWGVLDDPANTRVKVSVDANPILAIAHIALLTDLTIVHDSTQTILSLTLGAGTWLLFGQGLFVETGTGSFAYTADFSDGTTSYAFCNRLNDNTPQAVFLASVPIVLTTSTAILFRCNYASGGNNATAKALTPINGEGPATHMLALQIAP